MHKVEREVEGKNETGKIFKIIGVKGEERKVRRLLATSKFKNWKARIGKVIGMLSFKRGQPSSYIAVA